MSDTMGRDIVNQVEAGIGKQKDHVVEEIPTEGAPNSHGSQQRPHHETKNENTEFSGASEKDVPRQEGDWNIPKELPTKNILQNNETSSEKNHVDANEENKHTNTENFGDCKQDDSRQVSPRRLPEKFSDGNMTSGATDINLEKGRIDATDETKSENNKLIKLHKRSMVQRPNQSPIPSGFPNKVDKRDEKLRTDTDGKMNNRNNESSGAPKGNALEESNPNPPPPPRHHHAPSKVNRHEENYLTGVRSTYDAAIIRTKGSGGAAGVSPSGRTVRFVDREARSMLTTTPDAVATHVRDDTGTWRTHSSRSPSMTTQLHRRTPTTGLMKRNALHPIVVFSVCVLLSLVGNFRKGVFVDHIDHVENAPIDLSSSIIKTGTTKFFGETVTYHYPGERFSQLDNEQDPIEYVICVLAATHVPEQRDAIRQTWGRNNNRVFFGVADLTIDGDLKKEFEAHQDLIFIEKEETYENLAWKTMAMIYAVTTHLNNFQFIWKTDDDVYVRVKKLSRWLNHPNVSSSHLIGKCHSNSTISRTVGSKWYVPYSAFPEIGFPSFSVRSYAVSKKLGKCIGKEVRDMAFIAPEDALVGILTRNCNYTCSGLDWNLFAKRPETNDKGSAMIHFGSQVADGLPPMTYFQEAHRRSCELHQSLDESCVQRVGFQRGYVWLFGEEVEYRFHNKVLHGLGTKKRIQTVVCVVSKASSSRRRDLIRQSWALDLGRNNNVFFGVSGPFENIKDEFSEHGDLIWVNREETFDNRAWKVMTMFHVVKTYVPKYRYITKIDDDVYIDSKIWLSGLRNTSDSFVGVCKRNVPVNRNPFWRSYVPALAYNGTVYPPHSTRGIYAISRELTGCIVSKAANRMYISVENALTAILAKDCGAPCAKAGVRIASGSWSVGVHPIAILHIGLEMAGVEGQAKIFEMMKNKAY